MAARALFAGLAAVLLLASAVRADTTPSPLVLLRATVIDATGAAPRPDQAVVVQGDRIVAVGPSERIALPPGARAIDAHGRYLIPGLWDLHVHVLRRERWRAHFPLLVAQGVVGVRDMGGDYPMDRVRRLRAEIDSGARIAPRFLAAGPFVDGPWPSLPRLSRVVANPAEARAVVGALKREGFDFVKVYNRLPREAFLAIADESRRVGLPLAGHVPFSVSAREASRAGMRSIEHQFNVAFACSSREDELMRMKAQALAADESGERRRLRRAYLTGVLDSFDAARCAALYADFARNGTALVPTLVQRRDFSGVAPPALSDEERAYVPAGERGGWDPGQDARLQGRAPEDREIERRFWERDRALVAPMQAAGVLLLAGTDGGDPYTVPGFSLHDELAELVVAGLTPMQALQAATRNAARFLGTPDDFGTIEAGRRADLVLLRADPLADIRHTREIEAVMRGGRWLDRADLDHLLAQARSAAGSP
jgi:imidazolonepropionase-like amidohydrolase